MDPEEKRRKALQERRLARERRIEESIGIWEREVLPDWTAVHRNPQLRRLWWQGIPTKLRATMWQSAVGNPLALSKGMHACMLQCNRGLTAIQTPSRHAYQELSGLLPQDRSLQLCLAY